MKDWSALAMILIVGVAVVAFNGSIPPQPDPLPGSLQAELNTPLPLPIFLGLVAVVLAMGAWLHSPKGMKSGCMGWLLVGGVFGLVIWAAYQF